MSVHSTPTPGQAKVPDQDLGVFDQIFEKASQSDLDISQWLTGYSGLGNTELAATVLNQQDIYNSDPQDPRADLIEPQQTGHNAQPLLAGFGSSDPITAAFMASLGTLGSLAVASESAAAGTAAVSTSGALAGSGFGATVTAGATELAVIEGGATAAASGGGMALAATLACLIMTPANETPEAKAKQQRLTELRQKVWFETYHGTHENGSPLKTLPGFPGMMQDIQTEVMSDEAVRNPLYRILNHPELETTLLNQAIIAAVALARVVWARLINEKGEGITLVQNATEAMSSLDKALQKVALTKPVVDSNNPQNIENAFQADETEVFSKVLAATKALKILHVFIEGLDSDEMHDRMEEFEKRIAKMIEIWNKMILLQLLQQFNAKNGLTGLFLTEIYQLLLQLAQLFSSAPTVQDLPAHISNPVASTGGASTAQLTQTVENGLKDGSDVDEEIQILIARARSNNDKEAVLFLYQFQSDAPIKKILIQNTFIFLKNIAALLGTPYRIGLYLLTLAEARELIENFEFLRTRFYGPAEIILQLNGNSQITSDTQIEMTRSYNFGEENNLPDGSNVNITLVGNNFIEAAKATFADFNGSTGDHFKEYLRQAFATQSSQIRFEVAVHAYNDRLTISADYSTQNTRVSISESHSKDSLPLSLSNRIGSRAFLQLVNNDPTLQNQIRSHLDKAWDRLINDSDKNLSKNAKDEKTRIDAGDYATPAAKIQDELDAITRISQNFLRQSRNGNQPEGFFDKLNALIQSAKDLFDKYNPF